MNMNIQKKILIAYHANCADGIGAAHAVMRALTDPDRWNIDKDRLDYLHMSYSEHSYTALVAVLASDEYAELYVVDFSLPVAVLNKILGRTVPLQNIYIMDHHKTAYEMYEKEFPTSRPRWDYYFHQSGYPEVITNLEITLDNKDCGTTLVYKELCGHSYDRIRDMPFLYLYIKDRDLWTKKLHGTDAIHAVLKEWVLSISPVHIKEQLAAMDKLMLAMEERLPEVIKEGEVLLAKYQEQVQKYVSTYGILGTDPTNLADVPVVYCCCPPEYASDVGNILAERHGYYSVTYSTDLDLSTPDEFKYKFSLRSVDRIDGSHVDVSAIAKIFGGGGHTKAAGFYASNVHQVLHKLQAMDIGYRIIIGIKKKEIEVPNHG